MKRPRPGTNLSVDNIAQGLAAEPPIDFHTDLVEVVRHVFQIRTGNIQARSRGGKIPLDVRMYFIKRIIRFLNEIVHGYRSFLK